MIPFAVVQGESKLPKANETATCYRTISLAGSMVMDILFILSSAIVGYLAWDAFKDMA